MANSNEALWKSYLSAIIQITTAILSEHYLVQLANKKQQLTCNFAVRVSGECDFVIKIMQLGVDKYITEPEASVDHLHTRVRNLLGLKY